MIRSEDWQTSVTPPFNLHQHSFQMMNPGHFEEVTCLLSHLKPILGGTSLCWLNLNAGLIGLRHTFWCLHGEVHLWVCLVRAFAARTERQKEDAEYGCSHPPTGVLDWIKRDKGEIYVIFGFYPPWFLSANSFPITGVCMPSNQDLSEFLPLSGCLLPDIWSQLWEKWFIHHSRSELLSPKSPWPCSPATGKWERVNRTLKVVH